MGAATSLPLTKPVCATRGDSRAASPASPPAWMCQAGQVLLVHPSLLLACSHESLLLLPRIVEVEQDNKMTSSNLGIVFGPTLMRPRPTDATISLSSLVDYPHQARIIEALIIFYSTIFENKEATVLADSSKYATDSKEEGASSSDLVRVSGEGSTLRGCGANQDSLFVLATWRRSAGADPPAVLTPPSPLLNGAPASCSALQIAGVTFPIPVCHTVVQVRPTLLPFSYKTHLASSCPHVHPHSTCK